MAHSHTVSLHEHTHDVEPIGLGRSAVTVNPYLSRTRQLFLLAPVDRLDGK